MARYVPPERNQLETIIRLLEPMTALEYYQAFEPTVLTLPESLDEFKTEVDKEAAEIAGVLGLKPDNQGRHAWLVWALAATRGGLPITGPW